MSDLDFELECICNHCSYAENILVCGQDFDDWVDGELTQNAFPYLSDDQRELIMTSTCGKCFDEMFPPQDYD